MKLERGHLARILFFCLLMAIAAIPLFAATLEDLQPSIKSLDSQITALDKQYQSLKKANDERVHRIERAKQGNDSQAVEQEMKVAYSSAEQLNAINVEMNRLHAEKDRLCQDWRNIYRKTTDDLLSAAEKENQRQEKALLGKRLQQYQAVNSALCLNHDAPLISEQWRALEVQDYDGPPQIDQKIQLLRDISREVSIRMSRLDARYQDAIRERKTRERAQEFVDEGTLFNEGLSVRNTPQPSAGTNGTINRISGTSPSNTPSVTSDVREWSGQENDEQFEALYKKERAQLLQEQKELEKKIEDFSRKEKSLFNQ